MTIQEALEKLQGYEKATFALNHATGLMYYDGATTAPKGTAELRGSTLGELSRMGYEPEFTIINWEEKKDLLHNGDIDCVWSSFTMDGREDEYRSWTPSPAGRRRSCGVTTTAPTVFRWRNT